MNLRRICFITAIALCAVLAVAPRADAAPKAEDPWARRCDKPAKGSDRPYCEVFQRLAFKDTGERLIEVAIGFQKKEQARAVIILPLGVSLPAGVRVSVDADKDARPAELLYCMKDGCYARLLLDAAGLKRLRAGGTLVVTFRNKAGRDISVKLSLDGFSKALQTVSG